MCIKNYIVDLIIFFAPNLVIEMKAKKFINQAIFDIHLIKISKQFFAMQSKDFFIKICIYNLVR